MTFEAFERFGLLRVRLIFNKLIILISEKLSLNPFWKFQKIKFACAHTSFVYLHFFVRSVKLLERGLLVLF